MSDNNSDKIGKNCLIDDYKKIGPKNDLFGQSYEGRCQQLKNVLIFFVRG
jgi:hypothetical protein